MSKLNFFANIVLVIGIILLVGQVVLIAQLDKFSIAINKMDTALSMLSETYVKYDNYITLYKSPVLFNDKRIQANNKVIYMNVKTDSFMSYEYKPSNK